MNQIGEKSKKMKKKISKRRKNNNKKLKYFVTKTSQSVYFINLVDFLFSFIYQQKLFQKPK